MHEHAGGHRRYPEAHIRELVNQLKVAGHWRYVSRAVDQFGQVIDVLVSAR